MDQFISALGKKDNLLLIDCRTQNYQLVPMDDDSVSVLIFNTNVKHKLVGGEYAQRRKQCEEAAKILGVKALRDADVKQLNEYKTSIDDIVYKRALHVIEENERTVKCVEMIKARRWTDVGGFLYSSHNSLKNLFEVSCEELDIVVELAQQIGIDGGIYGCRMTGGGFGGCTVALVKSNMVQDIAGKLIDGYKEQTGIEPAVFASRPANGAEVLMQ
jgi:galactokinase